MLRSIPGLGFTWTSPSLLVGLPLHCHLTGVKAKTWHFTLVEAGLIDRNHKHKEEAATPHDAQTKSVEHVVLFFCFDLEAVFTRHHHQRRQGRATARPILFELLLWLDHLSPS